MQKMNTEIKLKMKDPSYVFFMRQQKVERKEILLVKK